MKAGADPYGDGADGNQLQRRLSENPFFSSLPAESLRDITARSRVRTYPRGAVIARELDRPADFLLILDGSVEICRDSEHGERIVYRSLRPPSAIGYSFLAGEPHTANLVASEEVTLACIPLPFLRSVLESRPEVLFKAISRLAELVDSLSTELLEQRTLPLRERVLAAVYRNADARGDVRVSHEELARYVGGTRANVTRALHELADAGDIELGRRAITISKRV